MSLNSAMLQVALIWFFCYYSALVSMRMEQFSNVAYSIHWYQFSIVSQKSILMIIRQSQKDFSYKGFGILQCDMETLKMVNHCNRFLIIFILCSFIDFISDDQFRCVLLFTLEEDINFGEMMKPHSPPLNIYILFS